MPVFVTVHGPGRPVPHWWWRCLRCPWSRGRRGRSTGHRRERAAPVHHRWTRWFPGVAAAYLFSLWHLVAIRHDRPPAHPGEGMDMSAYQLYSESAARRPRSCCWGVGSRPAPSPAPAREALKALLDLGAQQATVAAEDGTERTVPVSELRAETPSRCDRWREDRHGRRGPGGRVRRGRRRSRASPCPWRRGPGTS
ncbi:hypothetical protein QJS66_15475 [Kocuria rhizophila]|nr:hypothetical protein QJS66_15475 [Kocuria rhizophila]